jgi:hypothetical protein
MMFGFVYKRTRGAVLSTVIYLDCADKDYWNESLALALQRRQCEVPPFAVPMPM